MLAVCDFCDKTMRSEKGKEDWFQHKNSPYTLCWECYNRRLAERKMAKFKKSRINTPRADKRCEWIRVVNDLYGCSECFEIEDMSSLRGALKNYCPYCGVKMKNNL